MKITLINKERNEYRFELTNEEACKRIYQCLSTTNPELKETDVERSKYSREFKARYRRSDGEDVSVSVGIPNLKRYFGAFVLCFTDDGIWFNRQMKYNKPKKKYKLSFEDEFS